MERPRPLRLEITGEVSTTVLAQLVTSFCAFVEEASKQAKAGKTMKWKVTSAGSGSFYMGLSPSDAVAESEARPVREQAKKFWTDAAAGTYESMPLRIRKHAKAVHRSVVERGVVAEVHDREVSITKEVDGPERPSIKLVSWGSIRGNIVSANIKLESRPWFEVRDVVHGTVVKCYWPVREDDRRAVVECLRTNLGGLVSVEGMVKRDEETGEPIEVQPVIEVHPIEAAEPFAWREAIGCCPAPEGAPPPEVRIRMLRDDV